MPAITGSKVILKQGDGASSEAFTKVAAARAVNYDWPETTADTTSQDDYDDGSGEHWTSSIIGTQTFTVTGAFLIKDKAVFAQMQADRAGGVVRNYQVEIVGVSTFEGPMRITAFSGNGDFSEAAAYTMTLTSQGRITRTTAS